ncbi:MAG: hypothetical protein WBW53_14060 [Terriglobales bacterium]
MAKDLRLRIPIEAGTDFIAGFAPHRELDVEAGVPPSHVVQIATFNATRIMHKPPELYAE